MMSRSTQILCSLCRLSRRQRRSGCCGGGCPATSRTSFSASTACSASEQQIMILIGSNQSLHFDRSRRRRSCSFRSTGRFHLLSSPREFEGSRQAPERPDKGQPKGPGKTKGKTKGDRKTGKGYNACAADHLEEPAAEDQDHLEDIPKAARRPRTTATTPTRPKTRSSWPMTATRATTWCRRLLRPRTF